MAFHFFTGENSINTNQLPEMAFGALADQGATELYNLENKFSVLANAPVFAITKSLLIAVEDPNNPLLLNFALLPIESNYTAGFPIKFFIYKGILKSSLIDGIENVKEADSSWDSNNILKIIKELQDKINDDSGSDDTANASSLGIDFSSLPDNTLLESIFFDELDDFHPLIVPKGCQIGKFSGGTNLAGMEIILDKIGDEATLEILKSQNHIFQIQKLDLTGLDNKEKLKLQFKNRLAKENVLAYIDITAFYGACENQGFRVSGVPNNTDYLNPFHNNRSVYIDIRDERGFSYNHFFKLRDTIDLGFYDGSSDDPVYNTIDYYQGWPILKLDSLSYNTSKEYFYLKLPILIGMPINANVITSFTKKVSVGKSKRNIRYKLLNEQDKNGEISLKESEPIRLKNWDFDDDTLGANYFMLKLDRIEKTDSKEVLSTIWNSFFSLNINPIFGLDNIEDGEFRVKTYSSINSPLVINNNGDEVFYPTAGIAVDKSHVTFFSYYTDSAHRNYRKRDFKPLKIIDTGKFNFVFDQETLNYQDLNQSVGFLYYLANNYKLSGHSIGQFSFSNSESQINNTKFLKFLKNSPLVISNSFFENFDAITLTHEEYNYLKSLNANELFNDQDFISQHPFFIKGSNNNSKEYQKFNWVSTNITLGVPKIEERTNANIYAINLKDYPEPVELDSEEIVLSSTYN